MGTVEGMSDFSAVWFWVFAVLVVPCMMLVSSFALLQFKNVLIVIMNISTNSLPGWMAPFVTTIKSAISEAFGNPRKYKPKMSEILLYSLIVAVLMLLPALWAVYEKQNEPAGGPINQSRTKKRN